ncbi:baseplate J/gp47 family protein [Candidatus Haliotispira prima]|uniref:Baseplate J/gp47 family protein n=1 Tax=Candidatus Haliotispira prima TaxID=3034016 RepID=A0ABY8MGN3_9SPIO|nr:baseplate J/gp47 family protein [Candidatus Haliotispira prima]
MASLATLVEEEQQRIESAFNPLAGTPKYNLLRVLAGVAAADRYLTQENLAKLEEQIFPDTATYDALLEHWRERVPPLEPTQAAGRVTFTGTNGLSVPAGCLLGATNGQLFYVKDAVTIRNGQASADVQAEEPGASGNLGAGSELKVKSTLPAGINSKATVTTGGVAGGVSAESDDVYRARVIAHERTGTRTGRSGDLSAWAVDSTAEVTSAWEFPNFDSSGTTLIIVAGGSHLTRIGTVANTNAVKIHLGKVAPLQIVDVRSAVSQPIDLSIKLLPVEDSQATRQLIIGRIGLFWQANARPKGTYTNAELRAAILDGTSVTQATVSMSASPITIDMFHVPTGGTITWESL